MPANLTRAVLAITLFKCVFWGLYQLQPPLLVPLPEGLVQYMSLAMALKGENKQRHSEGETWLLCFISHCLRPLVPALSEMTSFPLMRHIFRQDDILMCDVWSMMWSRSLLVPTLEPVADTFHYSTKTNSLCGIGRGLGGFFLHLLNVNITF